MSIRVVCTPRPCKMAPFQYERSTGNNIFSLARLFDSLVRVSRRVETPHFLSPAWSITEEDTACPRGCRDSMSARFTNTPVLHFGYGGNRARPAAAENAVGLVLATEMEVLPLSLSRFQVLCHSLSKVLFKLSLTLLVRYRSSYSVFNFGRHIPAD